MNQRANIAISLLFAIGYLFVVAAIWMVGADFTRLAVAPPLVLSSNAVVAVLCAAPKRWSAWRQIADVTATVAAFSAWGGALYLCFVVFTQAASTL